MSKTEKFAQLPVSATYANPIGLRPKPAHPMLQGGGAIF